MSASTNDPSEPPGSSVRILSLPNLRDLGGWTTIGGGTVRRCQVFRSTVLLPVFGVEPKYLEASLGEMRARYGTIEQYFTDGLGIAAPTQSALRAAIRE